MSRVTSIAVLVVLGLWLCATSSAFADTVRVRKDAGDLTAQERRDYVEAVLELKSVPSPYDSQLSYYDQFVAWHLSLSRCDPNDLLLDDKMLGHAGPVFLPWHRKFVLMFEDALREVSGKPVTVPYWDWTERSSTDAVFANDFMGGDGDPAEDYAVTSGPFRKDNWKFAVLNRGIEYASSVTTYITRHFGSIPGTPLPTAADVRQASTAPLYDVPPFDDRSDTARSFRNALEGWPALPVNQQVCGPDGFVATVPQVAFEHELHNVAHLWVGGIIARSPGEIGIGTMAAVPASPNDPVFFLHHANVDRLWAQWQATHGAHSYVPTAGVAHNSVDDVMQPFDEAAVRVTPRQMGDIGELGYRYGAGPTPDSTRPALRLSVRPRSARAGRTTRFRFRATYRRDGRRRSARGATVRFAGHRVRTDPRGRASIRARFARAGRISAVASKHGFRRGRVSIRIVTPTARGATFSRAPGAERGVYCLIRPRRAQTDAASGGAKP